MALSLWEMYDKRHFLYMQLSDEKIKLLDFDKINKTIYLVNIIHVINL